MRKLLLDIGDLISDHYNNGENKNEESLGMYSQIKAMSLTEILPVMRQKLDGYKWRSLIREDLDRQEVVIEFHIKEEE